MDSFLFDESFRRVRYLRWPACFFPRSFAQELMRLAIRLVTLALPSFVWAGTPIELANGHSPNGSFSIRIKSSENPEIFALLEVVEKATNRVVGSTDAGGYAHFPAVTEDGSTAVLWAPDSKHFALMTRETKRSTSLRVYQVASTGLTEIAVPSATDRAFEILKAKESYRSVLQRPMTWNDKDTLVVRASGDIKNPAGNAIPIWYEVDITFDISDKKIIDAKIIETKPQEG